MESLELLVNASEEIEKLKKEAQVALSKFQVNQVQTNMLDGIQIDHHGVATEIQHIASIAVKDNYTLTVTTWEKNLIPAIEKAIAQHKDYDFSTRHQEGTIYAILPALTEESRTKTAKRVNEKSEEYKVKARKKRDKYMQEIKQIKAEDISKRAKEELQKLTDEGIARITTLQKEKIAEIMTV